MTTARRQLALVALLATGCASALKEPPPLESLQHGAAGPGTPAALLEEATAAYAKRPDREAVGRSEELCLQAAQADEVAVDGLVCAIRAKSWLAEREKDAKVRTELSVSAVHLGQWCQKRDPASVACKYWLAVALGMQARDRPTTAEDGLRRMAQLLREVGKADPLYDEAGPERVLAMLQLRAPGWPVGPGDDEESLVSARKAVQLRPDYPPNLVTLGEALLRNGERAEGRKVLERAVDLAGRDPWTANPDAPGWIAEAKALLRR